MSDALGLDSELDPEEPDFSVTKDHRLVAYVWDRDEVGGTLRVGQSDEAEVIRALDFADVIILDRTHLSLFHDLGDKCDEVDAYLFSLGVEGFEIHEGRLQPNYQMRRF